MSIPIVPSPSPDSTSKSEPKPTELEKVSKAIKDYKEYKEQKKPAFYERKKYLVIRNGELVCDTLKVKEVWNAWKHGSSGDTLRDVAKFISDRNWTKADRSKFDDDFKNVVSIFLNKKGIGTIASPAIKAKDSDLKKAVALISKFPPDSLQGEAVQEDILKLIEKLITANPTTLKIESSSCQDAYELFCKLTTANKIKVLKYGLITTIKEGLAKKDSAKLDEIMTSICKNELLSGNTDILRGSAFLYLRTLSSEQIESLIEVTISSRYKETEAMKHAGDCLLSYYNKNTEPYSLIHRLLFNQVKNLPTLQSRSNSVPQSLSEAIHTHIHNRLKTSKDSILFIQEAVAYIANLAGNEAKEKVIEWKYDFLLYLSENGVGHDAPTRKFIEALSQDDKSSFIKRLDPLIAAEEEKRNSCLREEFNKKSVLDTRILNYKHVRKLLKG